MNLVLVMDLVEKSVKYGVETPPFKNTHEHIHLKIDFTFVYYTYNLFSLFLFLINKFP